MSKKRKRRSARDGRFAGASGGPEQGQPMTDEQLFIHREFRVLQAEGVLASRGRPTRRKRKPTNADTAELRAWVQTRYDKLNELRPTV